MVFGIFLGQEEGRHYCLHGFAFWPALLGRKRPNNSSFLSAEVLKHCSESQGRKGRCLDSQLSSIMAAYSSSFALLYFLHLFEWCVIKLFQCSWPRSWEICRVFGRGGKKAGLHLLVIKCHHFTYSSRELDRKVWHQCEWQGDIVQVLNRGQALRNTEL